MRQKENDTHTERSRKIRFSAHKGKVVVRASVCVCVDFIASATNAQFIRLVSVYVCVCGPLRTNESESGNVELSFLLCLLAPFSFSSTHVAYMAVQDIVTIEFIKKVLK